MEIASYRMRNREYARRKKSKQYWPLKNTNTNFTISYFCDFFSFSFLGYEVKIKQAAVNRRLFSLSVLVFCCYFFFLFSSLDRTSFSGDVFSTILFAFIDSQVSPLRFWSGRFDCMIKQRCCGSKSGVACHNCSENPSLAPGVRASLKTHPYYLF